MICLSSSSRVYALSTKSLLAQQSKLLSPISSTSIRSIGTVARIPFGLGKDTLINFKKVFDSETPTLFAPGTFKFPASNKWFKAEGGKRVMQETYFEPHEKEIVEVEVTQNSQSGESKFDRISLPLRDFVRILNLPTPEIASSDPIPSFFLAQSTPPQFLAADLPTPSLIKQVGKGDNYGHSIWLGTTPTLTPLHRDPNPNLLIQIEGKKIIRLVNPEIGKGLMELAHGSSVGNLIDESVMSGEIKERLDLVIFGNPFGPAGGRATKEEDQDGYDKWESLRDGMLEAEILPGDGIFIPAGWYHAVKGVSVRESKDGELGRSINCSVNWWFR